MTKYHDVKLSMLRTCTRQRNCGNVPTQTSEVYFRRTLCIPYVNKRISGKQDRYYSLSKKAVMALVLIREMALQNTDAHIIFENFKPFVDFITPAYMVHVDYLPK